MILSKIKLYILSLILLSVSQAFSQQIERCFLTTPEQLIPTLSKKNRLELLEYHKAGQGDSVENRFGKQAYLQIFDTLHGLIRVKPTANAIFEMKILNADKPIVGIIKTVCAPICQSVVEFYDSTWHKLAMKFEMPVAKLWIDKDKLAAATELDKVWVEKVLENSFVSLNFDLVSPNIIATNHSLEFMSEADRKVIQPILLNKPICYQFITRTWVMKP